MRAIPPALWSSLCAPTAPPVEPGVPDPPLCGQDPTPPATTTLLRAADEAILRAIFGGYAHCGRMVDGNTMGRTRHLVVEVWEPGVHYAQLHATRCGSPWSGAAQSASAVGDSGVAVPDITADSPLRGSEFYLETDWTQVDAQEVVTGVVKGGVSALRYISVTEQAAPQLGVHMVDFVCGFCLAPAERTADLETL